MNEATNGSEAPSSGGGGGGGSQPTSAAATATATTPALAPAPMSTANAPPPFLSKTYDMVDDPATDPIVSWSPTNNSFVVWNPPEFTRDLLPKYFKHSNFSSFVRQLNTYGFRKVDPDRWEFANEGFLRGQKHLLRSINRRKPVHGHSNQQQQPTHTQSSVGACVEVGKFGLEEEVERLKRDKNVLMQELVRLRQQQQSTDNQLQTMVQRLQGMEQRQQQMMSFLAKAVQSPGFLAQFVQQQNESNRRITEANKKRRLKQDGIGESEISAASGRQIVKYQPMTNEAMFRQIMKADTSGLDSFKNNPDGLLIRDGSASSTAIDNISASSRVSGVMLQEVLPTSGQTSCFSTSSGISIPATAISELQSTPQSLTSEKVSTAPFPDMSMLVGAQEVPSIPISDGDVVMPELSRLPEMVPEGIYSIPDYNFMVTEASDEFIDQTLGVNGPIDISSFSTDPEIEALLESSTFWDDLIMQSPEPEQSSPDGMSKEVEQQPKENGFSKTQHVDELTEQMGLLASDSEGV